MSFTHALDASLGWLSTVFLLATRLGALLLATPPLGARAIPPSVRLALVVGMAAALAAWVPPAARAVPADLYQLMLSAANELALGATMALGISFAFAAFSVGARLLDIQIGFGIGQVFDPVTQTQVPVLSGAFGQLAMVLFFVTDAHLTVFRGLALSIERFPPGAGFPLDAAFGAVVHQAAAMFSLGFALVAPVVFCLALIDLGLGVLARNLPQMNMFVVGIPVKIVAGLAALSLWMLASGAALSRINAAIFTGWEAWFR